MKVKDLINKYNFNYVGSKIALENEIDGVFVGDLLSWVMGNAKVNQAWVTVQSHVNVIAVASLRELSCIFVVHNSTIDESVIKKAEEENVIIIQSSLSAYEICSLLSNEGL